MVGNGRLYFLIVCGVALLLIRCSVGPIAGGSDNPDFLMGIAVYANNSPAGNTQVLLIPDTFDPCNDDTAAAILYDTTDASGVYQFTVSPGTYNIQALNLIQRTRFLVTGITVADCSVVVPQRTLRTSGTVRVMLLDRVDAANGYVCIRGTNIARSVSSNTEYIFLDSVPSGTIPEIYYTEKSGTVEPATIADSVIVPSGGTVTVVYHAYSQRLCLNTTPSGAGVAGNVYNFPVLVRLTNANFNFSQARSRGEDIRFTKSDNTPLPYEAELWDPAGGQAVCWVLVDTVYGNDSSHCITMYWGSTTAADSSQSEAVFDTMHGFQGVWHMAQAGNTPALDATMNNYDGTPTGMSAASAVAGMIGNAQQFDGATSGITLLGTASGKMNFYRDGYYTLSAWAYVDTLDSLYNPIITKSDYQYGLQVKSNDDWEFFILKDSLYESSRMQAVARQWKHLVGVRDGDRQYLYLDGVCVVDTIEFRIPVPPAGEDTTFDVSIGYDGSLARYLKGMIDEVRVSNVARSPDWIRLEYMNQKAEDALVVFKP